MKDNLVYLVEETVINHDSLPVAVFRDKKAAEDFANKGEGLFIVQIPFYE